MKPFRIFINGSELERYTSATLTRKKDQMTGELSVEVFYPNLPNAPVLVESVRGAEILVYVGGELAFTGIIDKRRGKSTPATQDRDSKGRYTDMGGSDATEGGITTSFGQQGYTVNLTARGKTKYIIDSSHSHPTGTFKDTTDKKIIEELVKPHNVEIEWRGAEIKEKMVRLRDGATVLTEVFSRCNENSHFAYENREGKIIITDDTNGETGDDLIMGVNILTFSVEQSEDRANSEITVKAHKQEKGTWGRDAIIPTKEVVKDSWVGSNIPLTIQHYGDGSPEALKRRAKFEADKRSSESKNLTIEVFHVIAQSGTPYDIGTVHYVEIPPEGVFDVFECIGLVYTVDAQNQLSTTLTLAPPPSQAPSAPGSSSLLTPKDDPFADLKTRGVQRRIQTGVDLVPGQYPASWTSAELSVIPAIVTPLLVGVNSLLVTETKPPAPPLRLPKE